MPPGLAIPVAEAAFTPVRDAAVATDPIVGAADAQDCGTDNAPTEVAPPTPADIGAPARPVPQPTTAPEPTRPSPPRHTRLKAGNTSSDRADRRNQILQLVYVG